MKNKNIQKETLFKEGDKEVKEAATMEEVEEVVTPIKENHLVTPILIVSFVKNLVISLKLFDLDVLGAKFQTILIETIGIK